MTRWDDIQEDAEILAAMRGDLGRKRDAGTFALWHQPWGGYFEKVPGERNSSPASGRSVAGEGTPQGFASAFQSGID